MLPYGVRMVINRQKRGQKGVISEPDGITRRAGDYTVLAYSASVDNESKDVYVRIVTKNLPTLAKSAALGRRQAPKWGWSRLTKG